MNGAHELFARYEAELDRIGIDEEARRYFGWSGSLDDAIRELGTFPSGLGTDGFWRLVHGTEFATWRARLETDMAADRDAI